MVTRLCQCPTSYALPSYALYLRMFSTCQLPPLSAYDLSVYALHYRPSPYLPLTSPIVPSYASPTLRLITCYPPYPISRPPLHLIRY
eukprot:1981821-Rhodomonas_salina.1